MMSDVRSVVVDGAVRRRRIDRYLAELGLWGSRTQVQRRIAAGMVRVDGVVVAADAEVQPGQVVTVCAGAAPAATAATEAEAIPLAILYEDEVLLAIDKPAGMVVHPAVGNRRGTLVAALLHHFRAAPAGLDPERLGLVHRLDKETSGVLVVAKDPASLADLSAQFKARTVVKEYLAFVWGAATVSSGTIDAPVGRHPVQRKRMTVREDGRPARTHYEVVARGAGMSLLRVRPRTGRTHQIRVHLASLGMPIVADDVYGGRRRRAAPVALERHALHAARLTLRHPRSGEEMTFVAPLPADLERLRRALVGGGAGGVA